MVIMTLMELRPVEQLSKRSSEVREDDETYGPETVPITIIEQPQVTRNERILDAYAELHAVLKKIDDDLV